MIFLFGGWRREKIGEKKEKRERLLVEDLVILLESSEGRENRVKKWLLPWRACRKD